MLLQSAASPLDWNTSGKTPLDVARSATVRRMLRSYASDGERGVRSRPAVAAEEPQAAEDLAEADAKTEMDAADARARAEAASAAKDEEVLRVAAADARAAEVSDREARLRSFVEARLRGLEESAIAREAASADALSARVEAVHARSLALADRLDAYRRDASAEATAIARTEAARVADEARRLVDAVRMETERRAMQEEETTSSSRASSPRSPVVADCEFSEPPDVRVASPPTTPKRDPTMLVATPTRLATATPIRPPRPGPATAPTVKKEHVRALFAAERPAAASGAPPRWALVAAVVICGAALVCGAFAAGHAARSGDARPADERRGESIDARPADERRGVDESLDALRLAVDARLVDERRDVDESLEALRHTGRSHAARVEELWRDVEAFKADADDAWAQRIDDLRRELLAVRASVRTQERSVAANRRDSLVKIVLRDIALPSVVAALVGGPAPLARLLGLLRRCRRAVLAVGGGALATAALLAKRH